MKTKKRAVNFFRYFFLSLGGIIILYPLSILVITAFKTQKDYMMSAVKLPEKWMFSNLTTVLETADIGDIADFFWRADSLRSDKNEL